MAGIKNLTVKEFEARINRFDGTYVQDWDSWLKVPPEQQAARFGLVLRKWHYTYYGSTQMGSAPE